MDEEEGKEEQVDKGEEESVRQEGSGGWWKKKKRYRMLWEEEREMEKSGMEETWRTRNEMGGKWKNGQEEERFRGRRMNGWKKKEIWRRRSTKERTGRMGRRDKEEWMGEEGEQMEKTAGMTGEEEEDR